MTLPAESHIQKPKPESIPWTNKARLAGWIIVAVGVVLRVARFIHWRSLWLDELYLAQSITTRNFHDLLFKDLLAWQAAPAGFLFCTKLSISLFGPGERALRLTSLLFNLASVYFFYRIIRRTFTSIPGIIALTLFAILGPLIYYASELKQYSCDVAVTLAIVLATMRWLSIRSTSRWFLLTVAGSLGLFFSHPAVFALAGVGSTSLFALWREKNPHALRALLGAIFIWIIAFAINYCLFIRPLAVGDAHPHLVQYWANRDAFMPIAPWSAASWLFYRIWFICQDPGAMWLAYPGVAVLAIIVGLASIQRYQIQPFVLLLSPIPFALLASAAHQYPFGDRLILFIVPTLIVLMAAGIEALRKASPRGIAGIVALAMLILPSLSRATAYLVKPPGREETFQAYQWIAQNWQTGDTLYLSYYANSSYDYYGSKAGFPERPTDVILQPKYEDDPRGFIEDVKQLSGRKRVWIVFVHTINGHVQDEAVFTKMGLDAIGVSRPDATRTWDGAQVLLYDCAVAPPPPKITP
jgi:hypothetical protein